MNDKEITKGTGKIKSKVTSDDYRSELHTMINGFQWTGQPMTKELAILTIEALQQYLDEYEVHTKTGEC